MKFVVAVAVALLVAATAVARVHNEVEVNVNFASLFGPCGPGGCGVPGDPLVQEALPDLPGLAQREGLNTWFALLSLTGLADELKDEGPYTTFAPNDEAFVEANLEALLQPESIPRLRQILEYHISQTYVLTSIMYDGMQIDTIEGSVLDVHRDGALIEVSGAKIVRPDLLASNGVLHVIDKVLVPPERPDIPDVVDDIGHTITRAAINSGGIEAYLRGPGPFTFFSPQNGAYRSLPEGTMAEPFRARTILLYHTLEEARFARQFVNGETLDTVQGSPMNVSIPLQGVLTLVDHLETVATVVESDVLARNGVVHATDRLLVPIGLVLRDVVDSLTANGLSRTVEFVRIAGLEPTLRTFGPWTVFAPTDGAWSGLPIKFVNDLALPNNTATLQTILTHHVLAEQSVALEATPAGTVLTTALGTSLEVRKSPPPPGAVLDEVQLCTDESGLGGAPQCAQVQEELRDILATNGRHSSIDEVLIPVGVDVTFENVLFTAKSAGHTMTHNLMFIAGLDGLLQDREQDFTLFSPSNEAWLAFGQENIDVLIRTENVNQLRQILLHHLLNIDLPTAEMATGNVVTMYNGRNTVPIEVRASSVRIGGAVAGPFDFVANNGRVIEIDAVLALPTVPQILAAFPETYNITLRAIEQTQLEFFYSDNLHTAWVPSNEAWLALPSTVLETLFLPGNVDLLAATLRYQTSPQPALGDSFTTRKIAALFPSGRGSLPTNEGLEQIAVAVTQSGDNDPVVRFNGDHQLDVDARDAGHATGMMSQLNGVIFPSNVASDPLPAALATAGMTSMAQAIIDLGLEAEYSQVAPRTVFGISNEAWDALPTVLTDAQRRSLIRYHTINGRFQAIDLPTGLVTSVHGERPEITRVGVETSFEGNQITQTYGAVNGLIHEVGAASMPASFSATVSALNAAFEAGMTKCAELLVFHEVLDALNFEFKTLFCPNNLAMDDFADVVDPRSPLMKDVLFGHVARSFQYTDYFTEDYSLQMGDGNVWTFTRLIDSDVVIINDGAAKQLSPLDIQANDGLAQQLDRVVSEFALNTEPVENAEAA